MGFRFRKSIKIIPGVRVNISKTGVSTSIGGKGATVNVSKRGARGTVGLPGTGVSYSQRLTGPNSRSKTSPLPPSYTHNRGDDPKISPIGKAVGWFLVILVLAWIFK